MVMLPRREDWRILLDLALTEDIGPGDLTSEIVIETGRAGCARIEARESLIVCGLPIIREVFAQVDADLEVKSSGEISDGSRVDAGCVLLRVSGLYASILAAERTALNFLGRLSGISTLTRSLVDLVSDLSVDLVDTRKTTPGWRALEKYAVAIGGGFNHRVGLYDAILVKDNHIAAAGGLEVAVERARAKAPDGVTIQIEVESEEMADRAIELGSSFLLLDNLAPEVIRRIVSRHGKDVVLEASGGIDRENLRAYAETGIARISMGALTHSVRSADVALEIDLLQTDDSSSRTREES